LSQSAGESEVERLNSLAVGAITSNDGQRPVPDTLPRRDLWLLPLVVILVFVVVLGASELVANQLFPQRGRFGCGVNAASRARHFKPDCVTYYKNSEGPDVEYRFNDCGYRSSAPCGPKRPGTVRIVFMGTSVTMGLYVPQDQTFAARTEKVLGEVCPRPVEVQNMGTAVSMASQPELVGEALRLSPDVVVLTVSPYDIEEPPAATRSKPETETPLAKISAAWQKLKLRIRNSRFALVAEHFALQDEQVLYRVFLSNGASRNLMSSRPTPMGKRMYSQFAATLDEIIPRFRSAGTPVVVIAVPNRIVAAMVSNHSRVEDIDPWSFGRRISELALQRGALPVDVTPKFAASPHAERLFYAVDNHPKGEAHAFIAEALAERLTDGSIPQMSSCRASQP